MLYSLTTDNSNGHRWPLRGHGRPSVGQTVEARGVPDDEAGVGETGQCPAGSPLAHPGQFRDLHGTQATMGEQR